MTRRSGSPDNQQLLFPVGRTEPATEAVQVIASHRFSGPAAIENVILEAGAGTGKTTAIVCRVLDILLSDPELDPAGIVLITFTEKAAAEIGERIEEALTHLAKQSGPIASWPHGSPRPIYAATPEQSAGVRAAAARLLDSVERLRSQTIHSFCQSLLSLFPLEAGIDPRFRVVEGFEQARLYEQLHAEWLEADTSPDADPQRLVEWELAYAHFGSIEAVRQALFSLIGRRDLVSERSYELGSFDEALQQIRRDLQRLRKAPAEKVEALHAQSRVVFDYLRSTSEPAGDLDAWIQYLRPIDVALAEAKRNQGPRQITDTLAPFTSPAKTHATLLDLLEQHRAAVALRELAIRFFAFLDTQKRRRGLLDFDDLLFLTDQLLEDERVLRQVRARYRYLFVDEFQDTDRVQARIVSRLATTERGELAPGRTLLVGDPKQSIYSFRRADPEMYEATLRDFTGRGARNEFLVRHYRSDPPLLEAINVVFTRLFGPIGTEGTVALPIAAARDVNVFQPRYKPLEPARESDGERGAARLTFLRGDQADARTAYIGEARAIAAHILRRRQSGESFRSFALLFRTRTHIADYLEVFDECGIPVVLPVRSGFLEQPAVVDLLAVLRSIAYSFDIGAEISAARSPYFALSDDEIATHRLRLPHNEPCEYDAVAGELRELRAIAREASVSSVVHEVIRRCGIEAVYAASPSGARALEQLTRLRELAAEFDARSGGTLRQFVDDLTRRREESDEPERVTIDPTLDAVTVLTVHAAKGLEFETVILADLAPQLSGGGLKASVIETPPSLVFTGRVNSLSAHFRHSGGKTLAEVVRQREEAETERLFYVAVTRARNDVVFVCSDALPRREFWKCICSVFGLDRRKLAMQWDKMPKDHFVSATEIGDAIVPIAVEQPDVRSTAGTPRFQTIGRSEIGMTEAARSNVVPMREVKVDDTAAATPDDAEASDTAARFPSEAGALYRGRAALRKRGAGILLHRFLEVWDGRSDTRELLTQLARESGANAETRSEAERRVNRILASEARKLIESASTIGREIAIYYRDDEGRAVEGRIDRLLQEGDAYIVVDYKSGKADPERLTGDREQVRRYCDAVSRMSGSSCRGVLWYIDADQDVLIDAS